MVLPPRGSERGQASELSEVEHVLLAGGLRVISSGVTGRVVSDASGNRVEPAANLSDLERALVLARNSNANALLQISEIGWRPDQRVLVRDGHRFREVAVGTQINSANLFRVTESVFRLQARVIDVDTGEIVMSIELSQGTSRVASVSQAIDVQSSQSQIDADGPERKYEARKQVMDSFLARLNVIPIAGSRGTP
jgi:hypothetical protein